MTPAGFFIQTVILKYPFVLRSLDLLEEVTRLADWDPGLPWTIYFFV